MDNMDGYELIDKYIKSLYKKDKSEQVKELKEEIREHLIMSSDEFILKGYDEEESAKLAIEKFDGEGNISKELYDSLDKKKTILIKLTKLVGYLAIICFVIFAGLVCYTKISDKSDRDYTDKYEQKLAEFTKENNMTEIKDYENLSKELLKIKGFERIKFLDIDIAKMAPGNTSIEHKKEQMKVAYATPKINYLLDDKRESSTGMGTNPLLDKNGNIVRYQFMLKTYPFEKVVSISLAIFYTGIALFIGYVLLKVMVVIKKRQYKINIFYKNTKK